MKSNHAVAPLIVAVLALLAIFTLATLNGCTTTPSAPPAQAEQAEPKEPLRGFPCDLVKESPAAYMACVKDNQLPHGQWKYSYLVQDLVTDRMLHWEGWARACPKFPDMEFAERKTAVISILGGIAMAESSMKLDPKPFREPNQGVDKVTGLPTYSEGLYQLSYKDAIHVHYKKIPICASISYPKRNITDGKINAGCAVAIMDNIIGRGGDIKAYWSSFNPERPGFKKTVTITKLIYPECF